MAFVSLLDFEEKAVKKLEKNAFDYYKSGSGEQFTLRLNTEAFRRCVERTSMINKLIHMYIC